MNMDIQIILDVILESNYPLSSKEIFDKINEKEPNNRYTKSQISSLLFQKDLKAKVQYNRKTFKYALRENIRENNRKQTSHDKHRDKNTENDNKIITVNHSNAWKQDEIVLALELYFDPERGTIDKGNPRIVELSQLLNNFSLSRDNILNTRFRSPSSVALKLSNFLAIDPNYSGSGMKSYSKLDSELFLRFNENLKLLKDYSREIREKIQKQYPEKSTFLAKNELPSEFKETKNRPKIDSKSLSNEIKARREEVEYLPISERCKNIITSIGGLKEAYYYYKKNRHFGGVRNCGKLTDFQLCNYFKAFKEPSENSIIPQKISFKELDLSELSERSLNVLSIFEDFTDALNFYQKTKSFISLKNCGSKTNLEIIDFFENHITKNQSHLNKDFSNNPKNIFEKIFLKLLENQSNSHVLNQLKYRLQKSGDSFWQKLSHLDEKALITELNLIPNDEITFEFSAFLNSYRKCIDLNNLNILTFDSTPIGETNLNLSILLQAYTNLLSAQSLEIQEYFSLLNQFYSNEQIVKILLYNPIIIGRQTENKPISQIVNHLWEELNRLKNIFLMDKNTESEFLPLKSVFNNFSKERSNEFLELLKGQSNVAIILFLINSSIRSPLQRSIIVKLFFDENYEDATLDLIAKEHDLSRERVRQIKYNSSRGLINSIFQYLNKIKHINYIENDNHYIILYTYHFFRNEYLDNDLINQLIALNFNDYIDLQKFIDSSEFKKIKINTEGPIFINSNLINEKELFEILFKLNNEPNFKMEDYLKSLNNYIKILDITEFIDLFLIENNDKENREQILVNELRKYLKITGKPVRTEKLLNYLISENYEITRNKLLTFLNNAKDIFTIFGQGNWALVSWRELGMLDGSLIEIIRDLLNKSQEPLHISEIYYFLNEYAPTSIHSILTNLKSSNNFQFFNCSFIGVKDKKYSNYYSELPIIVGFYFNQKEIDKLNTSSLEDVLKYYEQEFGYPKIHVEYLLLNNFEV
jgi:5-methylcytosine-specific restriction protein A